jgi:thiol oxidase|uniref:Sulfhydryl oxidase n=1 Tax=Globisporangium ultimum (strain ATCC 200006 / CBS 805.95 / DAOM BR144) TaxID=431595 RepID=K3X8M6_GLOUD
MRSFQHALVVAAVCLFLSNLAAVAHARFRDNTPLFEDSFLVRNLGASNWDEMINATDDVWIVDFYSPWCPHCRDFAPEWEKVAAFYAESTKVHVGAVDCTKQDAICTREKIHAYPAVKLFHVPRGGEAKKFITNGAKYMKGVVKWVEASLFEQNMQSGIDTDTIDEQIAVIANDRVKDKAGGDPHGKLKEQSLTMKYTRLRDAGAAAVFTLESGLFMGTDVLDGERYNAALQWIDALAASFPLEVNRAAFANLAEAARRRESWDKTSWTSLIAKWKDISRRTTFPKNLLASNEEDGWANCGTYTCGLWTLFHSMSASVDVERPTKDSGLPTLKPSQVAAAIRVFVMHFFGCENCVKHFLAANPPSVIDELAKSDAAGSQKVIMWVWRMHNKVNKVLKKGFWPLVRECPICYADNVQVPSFDPAMLHEDGIAAFVKSVYGHKEADVFAMNYQTNGLSAVLESSLEGFGSILAGGAFFIVCGIVAKTYGHRLMEFQRTFGRQHTA